MQSGARRIELDGYFRRRNSLQDHLSLDLRLTGVEVEQEPANRQGASDQTRNRAIRQASRMVSS